MQLYFAPLACSMSSRIVLDEVGVAASFVQVDTRSGRLVDGSDYLAVNPLGQVPVLRLDGGEILTENAAILQYIARRHAPVLLGRESELAELQSWLSFISTELHKAVFTPLLSAKAGAASKEEARAKIPARFDLLAIHLAGREHLLGEFTIADAYLVTVLNWSSASGIDLKTWPAMSAACWPARASPGP